MDEPQEAAGFPAGRLWPFLEEAVAGICAGNAPRERMRGAIESAASAALRACGQGSCETCERIWRGRGIPCEKRKQRHLAKRIAMTLLPMMRRGCGLEAARAALEAAVAGALGSGGWDGTGVASSGCKG